MLPTPQLNNRSSWVKIYHAEPNYEHLKVCGCYCYPNLKPYNGHKFSFKTIACTFLGFDICYQGNKCITPNSRLYVARYVLFNKVMFPYATHTIDPILAPTPSQALSSLILFTHALARALHLTSFLKPLSM